MSTREDEARSEQILTVLNATRRPILIRVKELEDKLDKRSINLISEGFYKLQLEHARAEVDYLNRIIESEAWRK